MARDEAVLRIVLDSKGVPTHAATPTAPPAPQSQPPQPAQRAAPASTPTPPKTAPTSTSPPSYQLSQQQQRDQAKALMYGQASLWSPPSQPVHVPAMTGMTASDANYLRMEEEARRRGISTKEYKESEHARTSGAALPPPPKPPAPPPTAPAAPEPQLPTAGPAMDPHEERRLFNEKRALVREEQRRQRELREADDALAKLQKQRLLDSTSTHTTPPAAPKTEPIPVDMVKPPEPEPSPVASPAPPKTEPVPVDVVEPPKQVPEPAAPPDPAASRDWMRDLVEGIAGANRHVLIEGQSGSGKSVLTRHLAFERMAKGEEVHVVDPGHGSSQWKGATSVFGAKTAGADAASFLKETLEDRKRQKEEFEEKHGREAKTDDFKPMTIVLSDFKKLLQDYPKLATELNAVLQEGRKFNISIIAEAASMSGIKGVASMRPNFAQQVVAQPVTATDKQRRVKIDDATLDTPDLPDYSDRFDPSIVRKPKPPPEPEPELPFDALAAAKKRIEAEEQRALVDAEYAKLKPPPEPEPELPFDPMDVARKRIEAEERRALVDAEYAKLKPPPEPEPELPFDALATARKRIEAEEQRALVDAEYAKLKPPDPPKMQFTFDALLEAAESMRGVVGGTFGKLFGIALDLTARLRAIRKKAERDADKAEVKVEPAAQVKVEPATEPVAAQVEPAPKAEVATGEDFVGPLPQAEPVPKAPVAEVATDDQMGPHPQAEPVPKAPVAKLVGADTAGAAKTTAGAEAGAASGGSAASAAMAATAVVAVVAAAIAAVVAVANEANKMVEQYGEYSPEIAQAQAMAEVRKVTGDMRRAQEGGGELAEFVKAQSEMQDKWEDVKMAIMKKLVPVVTGIFEILSALLGIAARSDKDEEDEDPTSIILRSGVKVGEL